MGQRDHEKLVALSSIAPRGARPDLLDSFEWFCSGSNVVHGMKDVSTVIPGPARVADADDYIFKNDKSFLVLKGFPLDLLGTNGSFAVFALITVLVTIIGLC
jgi:hypothetical protein